VAAEEHEPWERFSNPFEALSLDQPEERLRRATLVYLIKEEIKRRGLTQREAARLLGTQQPPSPG